MGRKLVGKWKAREGKEIGRRAITGPSECLSKLRTEKYLLNSARLYSKFKKNID